MVIFSFSFLFLSKNEQTQKSVFSFSFCENPFLVLQSFWITYKERTISTSLDRYR